MRQFPNFPRQLKSFRRRTSVSVTSLNMNPRSTTVSRVLPKIEEFNATSVWHLVSFVWGFVRACGACIIGGSRRGLQDRDSQHGGSLTDTRTEIASAIELSALKPGFPCYIVLTAGRDVYEERLCVWPISGDRWIMVSPDGTLIDAHINHLLALRDVTGKQTYPREAEQIDQFELPVSDEDFRNWVRRRSSSCRGEIFPNKLGSGFDWEGQTLSLQDGFMRSAFRRIVGKPLLLFRSLPQIRCQSQGLWMRPRSLCMRCLLKGTMAPFPG